MTFAKALCIIPFETSPLRGTAITIFNFRHGVLALLLLSLAACATDLPPSPSLTLKEKKEEEQQALDPAVPQLAITSHQSGQIITGSRLVQLAGTISSPTEITGVTLTHGEAAVPVTWSQTAFSAEIFLGDGTNGIKVTASDVSDATGSVSITLKYPFLAFKNGQAASLVIGAPDFETNAGGTGASNTEEVLGRPAYTGHYLYLADYKNNRVLGYAGVPTTNGAAADFVLGQPTFTANSGTLGQGRFVKPTSVSAAHGRLAVSLEEHRVALYLTLPTSTFTPPDLVLGKPSFDGPYSGVCSATNLNLANDVLLVGNRIIVSDSFYNRVLVWNSIPAVSGAPADLVIGQTNFESCSGSTSSSRLRYPTGIWSDGNRLLIADRQNVRVLLWNQFPQENGAPADIVLGQPNMHSNTKLGASQSTFVDPLYVASNGNQIFVADCGHGVMIWDSFPTANSTPADRLLGQQAWGDANTTVDSKTLGCPSGFEFIGDDGLLVTSYSQKRTLLFKVPQ